MRQSLIRLVRITLVVLCAIGFVQYDSHAVERLASTDPADASQLGAPGSIEYGEPVALHSVFSSGGLNATSTTFSLRATIGEGLAGVSYAPDLQLVQGFWSSFAGKFSCCIGVRGDVDGIGDPVVPDLTDFVELIDHLFISLEPLACYEEANLDLSQPEGPNSVTMADLTVMVDHFFVSLRPLPNCP